MTSPEPEVPGTGSHMVLNGKPLTSGEKRIAGSYNRKSRDFEWETAEQCEKGMVGSRGSKTAEKTRAPSPKSNFWNGGGPLE